MIIAFPTGSRDPLERHPVALYSLLGVNLLIYLITKVMSFYSPAAFDAVVRMFGFVPREFRVYALVTNLFLHGNDVHFIGNMLLLWALGINLEDRLGSVEFLILYLVTGICASLFHGTFVGPLGSHVPCIGASGAIFGLSAAYLVLMPLAEVRFSYLFLLVWIVRSGTFYIAGCWLIPIMILFQLLGALVAGSMSEIAYWAHIGGFLAGLPFGIVDRYWRGYARRVTGGRKATDLTQRELSAYRMKDRLSLAIVDEDVRDAYAAYRSIRETLPDVRPSEDDMWALCSLLEDRDQLDRAGEVYREVANDGEYHPRFRARMALALAEMYSERIGDQETASLVYQKLAWRFGYTQEARIARERLKKMTSEAEEDHE